MLFVDECWWEIVDNFTRCFYHITVAICANVSGNDRIKLLVIGKTARERCSRKTFDPKMYVTYYNIPKSWMTSSMFQDWFAHFNRQMSLKHQRVIFLVDNAANHSIDGLNLANVKVNKSTWKREYPSHNLGSCWLVFHLRS